MTAAPDHDAYIAKASETFRPLLHDLRAALARALPEADEMIAYDMPGFRIDGTTVAGYAAFATKCGLYVQPAAIAEHAEEIAGAGLASTKTGVTFTARNPIPAELVEKLAVASKRAATT